MTEKDTIPVPLSLPFWLQPVNAFGWFVITTLEEFTCVSLAIHSISRPPWRWQSRTLLTVCAPVSHGGYIVRGLLDGSLPYRLTS
jgi:hypothetical protein